MDQIRNFIDMVAQGNNTEAKSSLDELLSARAFDALEAKKQQIASTLFVDKNAEEPSTEVAVDNTETTETEQE